MRTTHLCITYTICTFISMETCVGVWLQISTSARTHNVSFSNALPFPSAYNNWARIISCHKSWKSKLWRLPELSRVFHRIKAPFKFLMGGGNQAFSSRFGWTKLKSSLKNARIRPSTLNFCTDGKCMSFPLYGFFIDALEGKLLWFSPFRKRIQRVETLFFTACISDHHVTLYENICQTL